MRSSINPKEITNFIIDNLTKEDSILVFPNNISKKSWMHWLVVPNKEYPNKPRAIETSKYLTWSEFNKFYLSRTDNEQTPITPELRQMFACDYINKNKDKLTNILKYPTFNNNILRKEADPFSSWLSSNIRELHYWYLRKQDTNIGYNKTIDINDKEDEEYLELYKAYCEYLTENNLYDPDWIDFSASNSSYLNNIELKEKTKHFTIIFPENIDDFELYQEHLEDKSNVTFLYLDKDSCEQPKGIYYRDSRTELRMTMMSIINLVRNKKADWTEIGLSVTNTTTWKPYIEREFNLYGIPYVFKQAEGITINKFGRIFEEIYDCYYSNFSYEALVSFLSDSLITWKDEYKSGIENLIKEGSRMRCICSYREDTDKDIWATAFSEKIKLLKNSKTYIENNKKDTKDIFLLDKKLPYYQELEELYLDIKSYILSFFPEDNTKKTFKKILEAWNNFEEKYLVKETEQKFEKKSEKQKIEEVCLNILNNLIHLETIYNGSKKLKINSPYLFFLQQLRNKLYLSNSKKKKGVNIYMYTDSACAKMKYQFVIDCSQKNLAFNKKRLTFLNEIKRNALRLSDTVIPYPEKDSSIVSSEESYLYLYNALSDDIENGTRFSLGAESFDGYQIPHNLIDYINLSKTDINNDYSMSHVEGIENDEKPLINYIKELNKTDYIVNEKNYILNDTNKLDAVSENQVSQFEYWKNANSCESPSPSNFSELNSSFRAKTEEELLAKLSKRIDHINTKQIVVNGEQKSAKCISPQSLLSAFYPCPRKWLLEKVLSFQDDDYDIKLIKNPDMGTHHHRIMELFMNIYKESNKPLPIISEITKEEILSNLNKAIDDSYEELQGQFNSTTDFRDDDVRDSKLAVASIVAQKEKDTTFMFKFLQVFLKDYSEEDAVGGCYVKGTEDTNYKKIKNSEFNCYGLIDAYFETPKDTEGNSKLIIVDYKNTKFSIPKEDELHATPEGVLKKFQMPSYYYMKNIDNTNIGKILYANFTDAKLVPYAKNDADVETLFEYIRNYEKLVNDFIKTGDFSLVNPNPTEETGRYEIDDSTCKYCNYKKICRHQYTISKKLLNN